MRSGGRGMAGARRGTGRRREYNTRAAARKTAERHAARDGAFWGSRWVLQEYVMGRHEFSTSLLVSRGEVLDAICSRYEYDAEEYVLSLIQL